MKFLSYQTKPRQENKQDDTTFIFSSSSCASFLEFRCLESGFICMLYLLSTWVLMLIPRWFFNNFLYCLPLALCPQEIIQFRGIGQSATRTRNQIDPVKRGTEFAAKQLTQEKKKTPLPTHYAEMKDGKAKRNWDEHDRKHTNLIHNSNFFDISPSLHATLITHNNNRATTAIVHSVDLKRNCISNGCRIIHAGALNLCPFFARLFSLASASFSVLSSD